MSSSPPRPWYGVRRLGRVVMWLSFLGLVYVLSMGPALQLNKRGWISAGTLETVYAPVNVLADVPGLSWALERYLTMWVSPRQPGA